MIWGVFYKEAERPVSESELDAMAKDRIGAGFEKKICGNAGFGMKNQFPGECDALEDSVSVVFQGTLIPAADGAAAGAAASRTAERIGPARQVAQLYSRFGERLVEHVDGKFAFCLSDPRRNLLLLGRDRFGMEPLFYCEDSEKVVFGTRLRFVLQHPGVPSVLDFEAMHQFLLFCYNPTKASFFRGIQKLPQAHTLVYERGRTEPKRYWTLSFAEVSARPEEELSRELFRLLNDSVQACLDPNRRTGVFLSGGMDSSSVAALSSTRLNGAVQTFSYRCRGESFDESHYAKIVSDSFHTHHSLVEYAPETVENLHELVRHMDEPFCDLGINLATDILGRDAAGKIDLVLTGDGGDELFGGHPVYLADRVASVVDRVPSVFKDPVLWLGSRLGDSEKKKDWKVKWKRFARSVRFPASLFSHRWRIYYTPEEIRKLLSPAVLTQLDVLEPYRDLHRLHAEADGKDPLSRSLYSDYHTVVGFYLRRMDLVRRFGIEPRFPLLDRRLVEFCATVPSELKIKNGSDVKYLLKKTMQPVLPRDILFRKDKLGHSIPMKNWMRDEPRVRGLMLDLLSESSLKKRMYFDPGVVEGMIIEHLSKKENHSHRLWALMVLELWFREHVDS